MLKLLHVTYFSADERFFLFVFFHWNRIDRQWTECYSRTAWIPLPLHPDSYTLLLVISYYQVIKSLIGISSKKMVWASAASSWTRFATTQEMMKHESPHLYMYGITHPHFFEHGSQFGSERENQLHLFLTHKIVSIIIDSANIQIYSQIATTFPHYLKKKHYFCKKEPWKQDS